jgi:NitT/TauT family transport system ATP-binding protein
MEHSADTLVEARHVDLVYPSGLAALRGIDLCLRRGEFISVVGPSGCGKSTLLRVLAGLLAPSTGSVRIAGAAPEQARRKLHRMAFVFQSPTLLSWRTVWGNVALPLDLHRAKRDRQTVDEVLRLVGLADCASMYPPELSGGMQMRVSLARALVTRPDLLLLDEPFGALDEITRQRLNEELMRIWLQDRWTGVFVTHNVFEAVFLSSRVLVMTERPGRIVSRIDVPLAYPRSPDLRSDSDFAALAGRVSAQLRGPP